MAEEYDIFVNILLCDWGSFLSQIPALQPHIWVLLFHAGYQTLWQVAGQLLKTRNITESETSWFAHNVQLFEFAGLSLRTSMILVDAVATRLNNNFTDFYEGKVFRDTNKAGDLDEVGDSDEAGDLGEVGDVVEVDSDGGE
jgi:hypothetical protein